MIIDCISDLHGHYPKLEGGDLLIVAGDLTSRHQEEEYDDFMGWIDVYEHSYKKIVIIAGNHDPFLEANPDFINSHGYENIEYLCDSGTEFEGLKIWGSPWTKTFEGMNPKCKAFTCEAEEELSEKWELIPSDTNILITHSPTYGILDKTERQENVGSKTLDNKVFYLLNLELHVFGHVHECGGKQERHHQASDKYISINCSHVNERYQPVNKPIRIEL